MYEPGKHLKETPSQTAGPYVHIGCTPNWIGIAGVYSHDLGSSMVEPETEGTHIIVKGQVIDGTGTPLKDALVEIWQADAKGLYNSPNDRRATANPHFRGWGRFPTCGTTGEFRFETIKPGRVPFKDGRLMAPHLTFWIVARGINIGLHTRMYFGDEDTANADDPVLARIEHKNRIPTLIAKKSPEQGALDVYTFDIHLQGEQETIFFDI
jgi:protocatechuate 3,4-dioxygenase, alpha subunit